MRNLSLTNNEWKQRAVVELSEAEQTLILDLSEDKLAEREVLSERIRNESLIDAESEDAAAAQAIYDQHKIEGADLIAADILLPEGTGIINCRLNGEHKQIRF
jgi:CheY-like chemotaxis protein